MGNAQDLIERVKTAPKEIGNGHLAYLSSGAKFILMVYSNAADFQFSLVYSNAADLKFSAFQILINFNSFAYDNSNKLKRKTCLFKECKVTRITNLRVPSN